MPTTRPPARRAPAAPASTARKVPIEIALPTERRRPRTLALTIVEALSDRVRDGRLAAGTKLATEAELMHEFDVSRTVVREALSKLQAAGMVQTRHGIGTFVVGMGDTAPFRIAPEQLATLRDVIAMLELRIGLETEAASLAAQRRTSQNLAALQTAFDGFAAAVESGRDAVAADVQFHLEIARATQNPHFKQLMESLGSAIIPRARLDPATPPDEERTAYLRRVNAEHASILDAIANQDAEGARAAMRTHLANSRERRRRAALQPRRR
ncbi:MAG: FadR family transcriptional regulator [Proteobacteria bacterium]|nr:FadR family transcriptional regulator [Pseudomonadota bacterium]